MGIETFSCIVRYWHDPQTNSTCMSVVRVDTGEEVRVKENSFLLRVSRDGDAQIERCLIRHLPSGHETYVQSGLNLRAFVKEHLLIDDASQSTPPGTGEVQPT
jgi:hypothetical protein